MAQKTEKEDAEIKSVPETLTPCIINSNNNISITGIASTNHSNCFTYSPPSSSLSEPCSFGTEARTGKEMKKQVAVAETHQPVRNRCSGCRRKVGLTGFRCRCGDLFCSEHRYSDRHVCSYDYKSAGKAAIARENPVVKASKINRI